MTLLYRVLLNLVGCGLLLCNFEDFMLVLDTGLNTDIFSSVADCDFNAVLQRNWHKLLICKHETKKKPATPVKSRVCGLYYLVCYYSHSSRGTLGTGIYHSFLPVLGPETGVFSLF